jgi:hypothetical protein
MFVCREACVVVPEWDDSSYRRRNGDEVQFYWNTRNRRIDDTNASGEA